MHITLTDQRSEPTCTRPYRAELTDAHGMSCGLGYGSSTAEAIGDAFEDCIDRIASEKRVVMQQLEAQAVAL